MNRSDLIQVAVDATGIANPKVEEILDTILATIQLSLACGESVTIPNFGRFVPRQRQEVVRVNPKTREEVKVPSKKAVAFLAAPAFKNRMNRA